MLFITSVDNDRGYRYYNMRNNLYLNFARHGLLSFGSGYVFPGRTSYFFRLVAVYNMTRAVEAFFFLPPQKKKLPVHVYHTIKYLTWMNNAASWKLLCDKNKRSRTRKRRRDINGVLQSLGLFASLTGILIFYFRYLEVVPLQDQQLWRLKRLKV